MVAACVCGLEVGATYCHLGLEFRACFLHRGQIFITLVSHDTGMLTAIGAGALTAFDLLLVVDDVMRVAKVELGLLDLDLLELLLLALMLLLVLLKGR